MTRQGIWLGGLLSFLALATACVWQHRPAVPVSAEVANPALPAVPAAAPVANLPAPLLRAEFTPPSITLTGKVPDAALRDATVKRAQGLYGAANVRDQLQVAEVARPSWISALFPPDLRDTQRASALLQDGRLLIEGDTANDAAKARVDAALAAWPALGVQLDNRLNSAVVQAIASELAELLRTRVIEFAPASDAITPVGQRVLDEVIPLLKREAGARFEIAGHTDNLGPAAMNQSLSLARASAVREALGAAGLDRGRFKAEGYGDERPRADNSTPQGRQRNRRIEFNLLQ